jgi:hypothetical protein
MWIRILKAVVKVAIVVGLDKKIKGWVIGRIDGVRDKLYRKLNESEEVVDLVDPWNPPEDEKEGPVE